MAYFTGIRIIHTTDTTSLDLAAVIGRNGETVLGEKVTWNIARSTLEADGVCLVTKLAIS